MGMWGETNCQSLEIAGRGFEPGFSRLRVGRSNRNATAPHTKGGRRGGRRQSGNTHVSWYKTKTGFTSHVVSMFGGVKCYIKDD